MKEPDGNSVCSKGFLKRMGPKVQFDPVYSINGDKIYPLAVLGKFFDSRDFSEKSVQSWIDTHRLTNGRIRVEKSGKLFILQCSHVYDRDNLVDSGSANLQGALFVFKPWEPGAAFADLSFDSALMWVKIEGLPVTVNEVGVARKAMA